MSNMNYNGYNKGLENAARLCEHDAKRCIEKAAKVKDENPPNEWRKEQLDGLNLLAVHYNRLAYNIRNMKLGEDGYSAEPGQSIYLGLGITL